MTTDIKKHRNEVPVLEVDDEEDFDSLPVGCGILGRYPILSILSFAIIGVGVGIGLSYWDPPDPNTKKVALKWIGLLGDLFIRALKCIILPLVFVNVVLAVVEMMHVGKAGSIGWMTVALYLGTTVVAAIFGVFTTLMLKQYYTVGDFGEPMPPELTLACPSSTIENPSYMAEDTDGNIYCSELASIGSSNSTFIIADISSDFVRAKSGARNDISLSDTIYDGVFTKTVTDNITGAFATANFVAIVFFAIIFGLAFAQMMQRSKYIQVRKDSMIYMFLMELNKILLLMISWVITLTPFAVLSLIALAIGSQNDLGLVFTNVAYLVAATVVAMALQFIVVYITFFGLMIRRSPFPYLKCMIPAQTMAFASASSAATIPVTLRAVKSTGVVPAPIARFVIPLGATVNMDGTAIYFPCACIWLAILNGITPNVGSYIMLVIIATIGSVGTAPVPSASLVLIITAYNTVFNTVGTPNGFSYILAIDWFMDRLRTVCNVTGDTIVCGIVSHLCPLTQSQVIEGSETEAGIEGARSAADTDHSRVDADYTGRRGGSDPDLDEDTESALVVAPGDGDYPDMRGSRARSVREEQDHSENYFH